MKQVVRQANHVTVNTQIVEQELRDRKELVRWASSCSGKSYLCTTPAHLTEISRVRSQKVAHSSLLIITKFTEALALAPLAVGVDLC